MFFKVWNGSPNIFPATLWSPRSQINYMDPRISVAWCKRNEVPIEKIFSKTLRDKFNWAMAVPPEWEFNEKIEE
jgi:hypothetical protein